MLSCVQLFVTPRTVAHSLLFPRDFPGKNTTVGCPFLLQGNFPTHESNLGLLQGRRILYQLSHQETQFYTGVQLVYNVVWVSGVQQSDLVIHIHVLEKEMAKFSSILAWEIPWTEEPGGLQSMGSQRVRHD